MAAFVKFALVRIVAPPIAAFTASNSAAAVPEAIIVEEAHTVPEAAAISEVITTSVAHIPSAAGQ